MTRFALPTGTVTFLLSDIEGSTKLWETHPDRMRLAVPQHYAILHEAVARYGGVHPVGQGVGDSIVAAFSRASDAVAAALDAQRRLHTQRWPHGIDLNVRIALHTGEAQLRDEGDYFGVALSRCARIRAIAHGGQTLLSDPTHDLVVDRLPDGLGLVDCGEHRLRDLGRPERVFALSHPDLPDAAEPLRSLDALPNNLPSQLTSFVGRARELTELRETLSGTRLLTLTGAGGSGKTRLALQLAAEAVDLFADGVWWVELGQITQPELIGEAIAKAMGVRTLPSATPLQSVCADLAERSSLMVLDNCEHLLEVCAEVAVTLLEAGQRVKLVATSRAPLGVAGETDWRVPALNLPSEPKAETVNALTQSDAVRLFIERALKVRPTFAVTNDNAPVVAQICLDLDGIPLAIELAAARTRMLSVEQISEGLADRFHLLTGGARTAMPRQQTLRASVDWSHELLSDEERVLLRRLGVFAGGFTLQQAEEVCRHPPLDRYAVLDLLAALVDKSLVLAEETGPAVRYRMLEMIRQYAAERLEESGERDAVRDTHLTAMLALAERAAPDLETRRKLEWLGMLDVEAANFEAALARALERDSSLALRVTTSLTMYWRVRGRLQLARRALSAAIKAAGDEHPGLRARALWAQAHVRYYDGKFGGAIAAAQAALDLATELDDRSTAARALATIGEIRIFNDLKIARSTLERSISLATEANDEWCRAHASLSLAQASLVQARHDEVTDLIAAADEVIETLGDSDLIALRWHHSAWVQMDRAELDTFWTHIERALAAVRQVDDAVLEGAMLGIAAFVDVRANGPESTVRWLEPMLERMLARSAEYGATPPTFELATAELELGKLTQARQRLERLLEQGLAEGWILSQVIWRLAEVMRVQGDATAHELVTRGLELGRRLDSPFAFARSACCGAKLAVDEREWAMAEQLAHNALDRCAERDVRFFMPDLCDCLAEVAAGLHSHEEAARIVGATDHARGTLGLPVPRTERTRRETLIKRLETALGSQAYDHAHTEGGAMSLEETIEWVRRARGARKRPPGGWESLTPTELRVIELASEGLTNAAIGDRMFISAATVKVHLAHVYRKLGVPNRAALATMAAGRQQTADASK